MAERNWRDEFEPRDKLYRKVTDVIYHNGSPWVYMIYTVAMGDFPSTDVHRLVSKPKQKTYRPWKAGEVPVGSVVVFNETKARLLITGAFENEEGETKICINGWSDRGWEDAGFVMATHSQLDGSQCGVEE